MSCLFGVSKSCFIWGKTIRRGERFLGFGGEVPRLGVFFEISMWGMGFLIFCKPPFFYCMHLMAGLLPALFLCSSAV
ncbi:hypothetical protein ACQWF5_25705, partial [Salmonella enterica subsp. enterica serovar Infantis]